MAKDKDKQINPAAAARKAEKAKAVKKGKAAIAQQRNDRLAKQNPHRLQSQIDDLKTLEANHSINPREKKQLDDLERELARVIKAKEAAGEKYIPRKDGVLGKRGRGEEHARKSPESSDTDPDVGDIPLPRDTPPPIPRRRKEDGQPKVEEKKVEVPTQAVYESKPVMRDLRKEAAAFVPAAVRKRLVDTGGTEEVQLPAGPLPPFIIEDDLERLKREEQRWRQDTKQVTIEDVDDENA